MNWIFEQKTQFEPSRAFVKKIRPQHNGRGDNVKDGTSKRLNAHENSIQPYIRPSATATTKKKTICFTIAESLLFMNNHLSGHAVDTFLADEEHAPSLLAEFSIGLDKLHRGTHALGGKRT